MVKNGNSVKENKKGSKKCCYAISTLVIILIISGLALVYREKIVEEFKKLRSESSENLEDSDLTTLYVEESSEETTETRKEWTTSTNRVTSRFDIDETTKSTVPWSDEYTDYEETTAREDENLPGKVLIHSQEINNYDYDSDSDSNESMSLENKTKISIDHISDIYGALFNKTQNETDVNDQHTTIHSSTVLPSTTLWEGSGSDPRDRGAGFIKSKPFESDDEDYQNGFKLNLNEGSG